MRLHSGGNCSGRLGKNSCEGLAEGIADSHRQVDAHAPLLGFDTLNLLLTCLRLFRQLALRTLQLFPKRPNTIGGLVRDLPLPLMCQYTLWWARLTSRCSPQVFEPIRFGSDERLKRLVTYRFAWPPARRAEAEGLCVLRGPVVTRPRSTSVGSFRILARP
jgi:hypothetical protein